MPAPHAPAKWHPATVSTKLTSPFALGAVRALLRTSEDTSCSCPLASATASREATGKGVLRCEQRNNPKAQVHDDPDGPVEDRGAYNNGWQRWD